jgi:hypothetical protein
MTPKEWAIANGYEVKQGRGRLPKHISDAYKAAMGQTQTTGPKSKPKTQPTSGKQIVETAEPVYSMDTKVYAWVNGKKVYGTMRAACFHSGLSLCYCPCPSHKAIVSNTSGYVPVTLEV